MGHLATLALLAQATTTTVNPGATGILPRPNSGAAPTNPGDPGGWAQLLLFTVIIGGLLVVGFLAWRSSKRARAKQSSA